MDMRYAVSGGGGCVARYAGGGGAGCVCRYAGDGAAALYDISMVDRMMMKFRPIAPKPVASGDSTVEKGGRGKRKYVRVKGNNRNNKKRKVSTSSFKTSGGDAVVTLSLMPETPDRKENINNQKSCQGHVKISSSSSSSSSPVWLSFNNQTSRESHVTIVTQSERRKTVFSWVKVEGVAEASTVEKGWGEMGSDTCPGFISDGEDRVVWMNKAYREMAGGEEEVVVVLVRNKEGGSYYPAAFTCNVRVTCRSGMTSSTLTVPCDAWRMEGGGYAWRLDVKAALSLGR